MSKYEVEYTNADYISIGETRILEGSTRRHIMKHLASENDMKITDFQASLSSMNLPNGNIVFVTKMK